MKNTDHDPPIGKTRAFHELEGREPKTEQSRLETSLPPSYLANTNRDEIVFSSQKSQFAEYTTWKGIENKTGIEKEDAVSFLVKELLDNAILTDFDASGLVLAAKAPNAYRIGIDFGTLQDLGLDVEHVEEEYRPGNHLDPLEQGGKLAGLYPKEWIDYITSKRIEINSVTEELNDNEKFWNWVINKFRTRFTNWDYTRAVDIPEYVMPKPLELLNENFKKMGTTILRKRQERLRENVSDIGPGLLFDRTDTVLQEQQQKTKHGNDDIMTISKYEQEIAKQSRHIIESALKPFLDKIIDLNNHLCE
jgi:hypothetical protein